MSRSQQLNGVSRVDTVLAESAELEDANRYRDAAELLARAAAGDGAGALLIERLAWVEKMQDHDELALALLESIRGDPDAEADVVATQLGILAKLRLFRRAVALLDDLPPDVAREFAVRDAAADLYRAMGLPALAVAAAGGRRNWQRGLWWATGGPLWFVRRRLRRRDRAVLRTWPADPPAAAGAAGMPVLLNRVRELAETDRRVDAVLDRAEKLIDDDELVAAAEVLTEALPADPGVAVLGKLAFVEELLFHGEAALARYAEARRRQPDNLDVVRDEALLLTRLWRFRAALALLSGLPEADRRDPRIRVALAGVYRTMGLPALAQRAYGDRRTLDRYERRERRRTWWRAGGPLRWLLFKPLRFERGVLSSWRTSTQYLRALDGLTWPAGFDPAEMRSRLDWHVLRWERASDLLLSIRWWVIRTAHVVMAPLVWYALVRLDGRVWLAMIGTLVAYGIYGLVFWRLAKPSNWYEVIAREVPAGMVLLGGGYAVTRIGGPAHDWWLLAGGVLVASAVMALCVFGAMAPIAAWWVVMFRRCWRGSPREDMLDELGHVLDDIAEPGRRNDLEWRSHWASRLERAAITLQRRLPASLRLSDEATRRWAASRAEGAAAALRRLKRLIAAPMDGSWDRLAAALRHEIVALATGDLGTLRWIAPPSRSAVRRSWWRTALAVCTALGLAVAPVVAVLAAQPLLHLDEGTLRWVKVAGLGWAILYLLVAADPKLREKIEAAQSVSSLITASRRPRPPDSEA